MDTNQLFFGKTNLSYTSIARSLVIALSLFTVAQMTGHPALASGDGSAFDNAYQSAKVSTDGQELVLQHEAEMVSRAKLHLEACAKYLAVAAHSFHLGNFERARPAFDKAFLMAAQLTSEEQGQMLKTLSEIITDSRDRRDPDVDKYFAQQRLKLHQKKQGSTPAQRYHEVQTLASSCSQHKRFKEAESVLLGMLKELESMKPIPENYGYCASTLASIFDEDGDKAKANKYYDVALAFARQKPESNNYERVLSSYLFFLLNNKMVKEACPIADEYYYYTTAPAYSNQRDRVSFGAIAQKFAESNMDEANKYYRAAFENQIHSTKSPANLGYGQTCADWAAMLHKFGKTKEAINVLQEGMAFCRSVKWPHPFDDSMPRMVEPCEKYMRESHREQEADRLHTLYETEKLAQSKSVHEERRARLAQAAGDPSQKPIEKVKALTEMSYGAFDEQRCDNGLRLLRSAVGEYEKNADTKDSLGMYNCFYNITARLKKCNHEEESRPLLLRIVRARMVRGFGDREPGFGCSFSYTLNAFDDYLSLSGTNRDVVLDSLLTEAKASQKPSNVIFLLSYSNCFRPFDEKRLANLEEIRRWRVKENDPSLLFQSTMQIAEANIHLNHFDKATEKWKQGVEVAAKSKLQSQGWPMALLSKDLQRTGNSFVAKKQLDKAGEVYIVAFKLSLQGASEYQAQMVAKDIEELAAKYRELGDTASGEDLLNNALTLSRAKRGADSLLERMWLIKLADFYAVCGDQAKTRNACAAFLASINKTGLSVSRTTMEDMEKHARVLKKAGLYPEASLVEKELAVLESQQCVMHDSEGHKH